MQEVAPGADSPDGRFVDHEWLNGDPVWAVYKSPDGWFATAKPQTIHDYAYKDLIAVCGEDPHLYGYRFVARDQLYHSREEAELECDRRNAKSSG